jgi:hypothetical protein
VGKGWGAGMAIALFTHYSTIGRQGAGDRHPAAGANLTFSAAGEAGGPRRLTRKHFNH